MPAQGDHRAVRRLSHAPHAAAPCATGCYERQSHGVVAHGHPGLHQLRRNCAPLPRAWGPCAPRVPPIQRLTTTQLLSNRVSLKKQNRTSGGRTGKEVTERINSQLELCWEQVAHRVCGPLNQILHHVDVLSVQGGIRVSALIHETQEFPSVPLELRNKVKLVKWTL